MIDLLRLPQVVTFAAALAGVGVWTGWALRNRRHWLYAVAPVTWLLHVAIFYVVYFACRGDLAPAMVNLWSAVVRMHGAFLVIGIGAGLYFERVYLSEPPKS